jgi:hypothetical protein
VNLEKLARQLRRDLAANPKKAAALGLMVLVALYFWGPLVWKWASSSGNKRASKVSMASLILTDDPAEPTQQNKARGNAKFRWEKARQLLRQDPRMTSAKFDPSWPEPFGSPTASGEHDPVAEAAEAQAATAAAASDPSTLGIVLGAVMIGPRTRLATINGKPCHEGDILTVTEKDDKSTARSFKVVRIFRQAVELEIAGRIILIEMTQSKLNHGDEIERSKSRPGN